jgi:hypothetical protein
LLPVGAETQQVAQARRRVRQNRAHWHRPVVFAAKVIGPAINDISHGGAHLMGQLWSQAIRHSVNAAQ